MQLLTILTLVYVAILVLALAASLIAILVYLRRINTALGEVRSALETVEQRSAPLEGLIESIDEAVSGPLKNLEQAQEDLKAADEHLREFLGQAEPAEPQI
jgi:uncharacterized protein YoxC